MSKHTAGPWEARVWGGSFSIDAPNFTGVAFVNPVSIDKAIPTAQDKANAALIAAAPELLDALLAMHMWCNCNNVVVGTPIFMDSIDAILKKSQGRTTMNTQITEADKLTLQAAKTFYGKQWRDCIAVAWHNGNYKGCPVATELQSIRNNPNVKWNINSVKI